MSAETDIYDFEGIFENALKAVFTAREVKAFTSQDAPDLQRDRPRVNITFIPGAGQGRWIGHGENNEPRETSWKGQYVLKLVTAAEIQIHSAFRTRVRSVMHGIGSLINATEPMTRHKLQPFFKDGGTTPRYSPQEGVYETQMGFDVDFSVQADAWASLET